MKKLLVCTLIATFLMAGSQFSEAKSKQSSQIPAEVGYFYVPGKMQVVSHVEEARLQREAPELLNVAYAPDAPPASEPTVVFPSEPTSVYSEGAPAVSSGPPMQLYHCVEVEDRHNIHPCAVTKIVSVMDPCPQTCNTGCGTCDSCNSCGSCCPPGCVFVQICVPPCGCPEVKVSRRGKKVKYDYGSYEVEIYSDDGVVKVDYDD